ncbi:glyoxylase-like metal-dependent hydrolase (beta-lactamase superfamily II) [Paenibacillus taihuensis]|uniref:Glyoxylase-like metal-dependent hydrolase (Beta-lactamase superfamily II) n=1 Tax=Paenibacillus taihuensis TaxID=1156355 RepID=A0A3D9S9L1_9BACL|nr:MBL fold metallo-hydrolase [Paenibacillus taihuensis]REE86120.1 glyoxylase-like metal-dependent hydrolase (beta-lactamase superfamily II) [Paenibacillus taihuensis]
MSPIIQLSEQLYLYEDTCQVYIVKNGSAAALIDFGSGGVLDLLAEIGVERVHAILMTHHHRDQGQGLGIAAKLNIPIWVPHMEQDLFRQADEHWQARELYNNYNVRQDRFSILESIPIAGTLKDYETREFAGVIFKVVPTPGHTIGSISFILELDGRTIAFTGDLIAGVGKLWSLAATQWSYNGGEGLPATVASLLDIQERGPDWLLPSHGERMEDPGEAIDLLIERLKVFMGYREQNPRLFMLREQPFEEITPSLLRNRTSMAFYFVLLSKSGKALFFDFGYDFLTGIPSGSDRASRRPWLYTLGMLKEQYGVTHIDAVVPTHYHDDHVAGCNLLRDNEGTQIWAAESFADVLHHPSAYDLPCLWYDPIPVDRVLPIGTEVHWEEYAFTLHPLPGHTKYAVAISFEADGKRVLITGDQYQGNEGVGWNYVYQNRFDYTDYSSSAKLYQELRPDVILTGHWDPLWVQPGYYEELARRGELLERLHRELLPLESADFGAEGFAARMAPYQSEVRMGETVTLQVEVINPFPHDALAEVSLAMPRSWQAAPANGKLQLAAKATGYLAFEVTPSGHAARRVRVAADITVNGKHFGQHAEALVTVR